MNSCVFCGWLGGSENILICSDCVQKFLALEKEQVQALYNEFIELAQFEKADLIENLLMEEDTDGRQASHFKKRTDGTRPTRFIRIDKKSSLRPTKQQKATIY